MHHSDPSINIILGPPGTGKTHNLLNLLKKQLMRQRKEQKRSLN